MRPVRRPRSCSLPQHRRVGRRIGQTPQSQAGRLDARGALAPPCRFGKAHRFFRQIDRSKHAGNHLGRRILFQGVSSSGFACIEPGLARCLGDAMRAECGEGERKIPAGPVHTRQHQAEHRLCTAHAARQGEAPDRRLEECGKPRIAHQRPASGDHRLQPVVPRVGEVARQTGADEIAARRELAVEAGDDAPGEGKSGVIAPDTGSLAARRARTGSAPTRRAARTMRAGRQA